MAVELTMPQMDQTMTKGKIGKWLIKEGDTVKEGDAVLEIETDKVTCDVESIADGVIAQLLVEEGVEVPVNAPLALIAAPGEEVERREPSTPSVADQVSEPAPTSPPSSSSSIPSPPPQPSAIKASPVARRLAEAQQVDLAEVKASGPGGRIVEADVQAYLESTAPQPPELDGVIKNMEAQPPVSERIKASPLARRLAKTHELDLATVVGSGAGGRIVRDDVLKAAEAAVEPAPEVHREVVPTPVIPMTGIRQTIAERMTHSLQTTASVTLNTEVDVTELMELRSWLNEKLSAKEVTLTYTDILVKVTANALRQHPRLNATLKDDGIHLMEEINIGVAVALEDGLIVPVITNADGKGLSTISEEIKTLAERARTNQLGPGELRGGTFTITNLGMFGIDAFTPIINPPECAILGVGRIVKKPAVHEDEITIRHTMHLSLSFDHRIVDGAPAAQFLQTVTEYIQAPYLLLV